MNFTDSDIQIIGIIVNVAGLFAAPLVAWYITIRYQERKVKEQQKSDLFLTLMAHRKKNPPAIEWVNALNQIDVVFQDNVKVRTAWRAYFDSLHPKSQHSEISNSFQLDLLSEMALDLGYNQLKQTEIDKFYYPAYFVNLNTAQNSMATEWYRVLRNSKSMGEPVDGMTYIEEDEGNQE